MATEPRRAGVRLIKRERRELQTQAAPGSPPAVRARGTNRALAATVSSWVEELRRRREGEMAAALLQLRSLAAVKI